MFLATHFDIFLAIESKISPKMSMFFNATGTYMRMVKIDIFQAKNIKSSYLEFQKSNIPQRKLKTHEIRIQLENIRITAKEFLKISIFFNFLDMLEDPQKIQFSIFQKF